MRLTELEPALVRREVRDGQVYHVPVASVADAQGVQFLCPACFVANGCAVGTHMVLCWSRSRGIPDDAQPGPGRWRVDGTSLADLTLNADPPQEQRSVLLQGGCGAHFHVTDGEVG